MDDTTTTQTSESSPPFGSTVFNVPNQISAARLVLAIVCFVFMAIDWYFTALVLFVLAAGTDWVDGFWARRYGQITQLGRILDPFADKIVICGAFIFLAALPSQPSLFSGITAWMAVVVVGRELLVTALRSFFEERGADFSAQWAGKWKMVFQCIAVGVSLYRLTYFDPVLQDWSTDPPLWMSLLLHTAVWVAIVLTIYSGWGYIRTAMRLIKSNEQ